MHRMKVSSNPSFLFLLGNNILTENDQFQFEGIKKFANAGLLSFFVKPADIYVKCRAQYGPTETPSPDFVQFVSD